MKPIKKVIIKYEKYEDGYSELLARISEKGDLVIDGCDAGKLAKNIKEIFYNAKTKRITLRLSCFCLYQ